MKIYTKTGDQGITGLIGGERVKKNDPRVEAYGTIDELNALLGVCRTFNKHDLLEIILQRLQQELFSLGAYLATPLHKKSASKNVTDLQVKQLEQWIDTLESRLEPLKNFIVPGGSTLSAHLHFARTVCRRAERAIVSLGKKEKMDTLLLPYINRLSDLLFIMARYGNFIEQNIEEKWIT